MNVQLLTCITVAYLGTTAPPPLEPEKCVCPQWMAERLPAEALVRDTCQKFARFFGVETFVPHFKNRRAALEPLPTFLFHLQHEF
jgi:hypothetical protein